VSKDILGKVITNLDLGLEAVEKGVIIDTHSLWNGKQ